MKQKNIRAKISRARTDLLLNHPWFGALAMNLRVEADETIPTFAVDGTTLWYNSTFADSLTASELMAVVAHEVMHCALLHPFRLGGRDRELANIAMDYVINGELTKHGFKLPDGCLLDPQLDGRTAWEVVFAKLAKQPRQKQAGGGQGGQQGKAGPQPPTGKVVAAPTPSQAQGGAASAPGHAMGEDDWKVATEQANKVAKAAGRMPGSLERAVQRARESKTDWRAELREFLEQTTPSDYSWQTPNRRYLASGLYLPGVIKEGCGRIAVAVDTSGSIGRAELDAFAMELSAICSEMKPEAVTIMYCDTSVRRTQECSGDEEIKLTPYGGGGTMFAPVFTEVAKWEEPPKALLYFTDMDCFDKPNEPEYPVLWITGMDVTREAPFGRILRIEI